MIADRVLVDDWHVVANSADLPEGKILAARLLGEDLVLWRSGGQAVAWKDLCPHRGSRLSLGTVQGGTLACPYHGWRYAPDGQCVRVPSDPNVAPPSRARATTYRVEEHYGFVWVSLGEPTHGVPPFAEWSQPGFRKIPAGPYYMRANAFRALENFIDATHFPFVHPGVLGNPDNMDRVDDFTTSVDAEGLHTSEIRIWPNEADEARKRPARGYNAYTYSCFRPLTACVARMPDEASRYCVFVNITPVDETQCILWIRLALNFDQQVPDEELVRRQDRITAQDVPIVESQRPAALPLDLQAELHVRADKLAVAYRRWLQELGVAG